MTKTNKIALILAGGVSLGAYQAGVLTEVLHALDSINRRRTREGVSPLVVDVITGASAGSMTGALVARIMMSGLDDRRSHLHKAWVEDIDILGLLANIPNNALLSKDIIWDIARRYLLDNLDPETTVPASFAPENLALSFSLSNMHGIDYAVPNLGRNDGATFASTFFSDAGQFDLNQSNLYDKDHWKRIVETALASGNFPVVFSPQEIFRSAADYPGSVQAKSGYFGEDGRRLSFLDGGMFNNEPLREAVHLAARVDGGAIDADRLFILVDPNINQSRHVAEVSADDPLEKLIGRMAFMVRGESTARDWLRTTKVNVELAWRDQLLAEMASIFSIDEFDAAPVIADKLKKVSQDILVRQAQLDGKAVRDEDLGKEIDHLRRRYIDVYPDLTRPASESPRSAMFLYFTYILNSVSDLQRKSRLNLSVIGADKDKTAGDQLNSFGGFFDRDWRDHDFRVGRIEASAVLPTILGEPYDPETDETGNPDESYTIPSDWAEFPTVGIEDADPELRAEFKAVILQRTTEVMKRVKIPGIIRFMLKIFLKRKLSNVLKLR